MVTYVFPGQGAQYVGMGADLFDKYSEYVEQADEILGYSIKELCLEDIHNCLANTKYTQPALYVVSALAYLEQVEKTGIKPDFVAGHSLGEYSALFAAGVFDFAIGLKIVKKRAELMSLANGGAMAAVIGFSYDQVKTVLEEKGLQSIDMANLNAYSQIVISGNNEDIDKAKQIFENAGALGYVKLNVSGAFHSRYMENAKAIFEEYINSFEFREPQIIVYSNVTAVPHVSGDIQKKLGEQMVSSVRWYEIITDLLRYPHNQIIEIGPGNVLTGLTKKIQRDIEKLGISLERENKAGKSEKEIQELGSKEFREEYNLKYSYCTGGMYKAISSPALVISVAKEGMLSFLGSGGVALKQLESHIATVKNTLGDITFGVNVMSSSNDEARVFGLIRKYGIHVIEAAAYISVSKEIVKYRVSGLEMDEITGKVVARNRILAKLSRPEVAEIFLAPAPNKMLDELEREGEITKIQRELARRIAMADDICVEGDSGGHTDRGNLFAMLPAIMRMRDNAQKKYHYEKKVRVGAAGGIGTPQSIVAVFMMGADFVMTGSINQCTVEAGTSERVKEMLSSVNIQDTDYCVSGDMLEWGSLVQVVKKGVFFPIRANKLYELYKKYNSLEEIDEKTKEQLQTKYFGKSFKEIWQEVTAHCDEEKLKKASINPKYKILLIFKWYHAYTTRLALDGDESNVVNYQIQCSSAMGSFNQYVKGTNFEKWQNRHAGKIGVMLMDKAANYMMR